MKWYSELDSGYVVNDIYNKGYAFEDLSQKPILPFEYEDLFYSQIEDVYRVVIGGEVFNMTDDQKSAVLSATIVWMDTRYNTDDNQQLDSFKQTKKESLLAGFNEYVKNMAPDTSNHEMISWTKQENQARAWEKDHGAETPIIDNLLISRDNNESKQDLVTKIIGKADMYEIAYAGVLGRYQKDIKRIDEATTHDEVIA